MFIERTSGLRAGDEKHAGWMEVVCGSMFSGKTEELIRRINRALIARQKVEIFKPAIDTRYHIEDVVSHNSASVRSRPVTYARDILELVGKCDIVAIDEAQFFDAEIVEVCNELANRGKRVIIAGLDMDSDGNPFGPMPALMAVAEYVTKVQAICVVCGELANYSFRKVATPGQVLLGETDSYEARCRKHFLEGKKLQ